LTKAGLRRDTRRLVLAYAGCLVVIQIVGAIVGGVAVIFDPAVRDMINDMIANSSGGIDLNSQTIIDAFSRYSGLASVAGLVAGASCFFAIRGKRLVTSDLTIVGERVRLPVIGQLFVLMMAVQLLASLMTAVLSWLGIDITGSYESGIESIAASPIGLVYVVLLGPFLEELIFRGAVLRHLQPYGKNFAIITSAVMFGLYHMILFQAAYAIPVGIILAYTASRFSLKWSLALHIANNGLAMLSLTGVPEAVFLIFYVLCGAGAVAIFALRRSEVRALPAAGAPVLDHPYQIAWSHPLFIIAALILLATGVLLLL
jgi:membrane protease YdiL (CAAX protease family)